MHCHDDIVNTRGPVCSRPWMNRYISMRIGNEITWTTPPEAVKLYLDLSHELAHRW